MYLALHSGPTMWALTRAATSIPDGAESRCGHLIFEGMVPTDLFPTDTWPHLDTEIRRNGFVDISEDLGLTLVDECLRRFGRLIPA